MALHAEAIASDDPEQKVLWSFVPSFVYPGDITADDAMLIELEENLRKN